MKRVPGTTYEAGITRFDERGARRWIGRLVAICLLGLLVLWVGIPVLRTGLLLASNPIRHVPVRPTHLAVESIGFRATGGVQLRGWFVSSSPQAPAVILVPGFKADRTSMVPYARFLHAAGFNVLLYDSRGTGASSGTFSIGLREVRDVEGAATYLAKHARLRDRRYGLLGVSLGAGVAIVAASHLRTVRAVVADSPYTNQRSVVQHLDTLRLGPLTVPLAPIGPWLVGHAAFE
ncbi:MAG: alpha/beta hydrolase [Chloroflexota bacterium]|nr:alpha/beta hydrolase [Chloroflexota bacterium]